MRYTHWFVTKGREPATQGPKNRLWPVALATVETSLKDLARIVEKDAANRATLWLSEGATELDRLRAISDAYIAQHLTDLWLSEVRLARVGSPVWTNEVAIEWIGPFDPFGRFPEPWQGSSVIIPEDTPVTIRDRNAPIVPFKVEVVLPDRP